MCKDPSGVRRSRVSEDSENTNAPHVTAASVWPSAAQLVTDSVIELENKGGDDNGYWIADPLPANGATPPLTPRDDATASGTPQNQSHVTPIYFS